MNGRPVTDVQISQALRAHLPARAQAGLRDRILESAETTRQRRAWPSFLGALSEADPVARRRGMLLAAALLVALALASAAAVGALRLLQHDPLKDLNLTPPTDIPAFVISTHDRMPQLPPVAITTLKSDATVDRIYVDRSGAVRVEGYASADATEPARTTILSGARVGETQPVGPKTVWLVNDEAISDDPRVFILTLSGLGFSEGQGCATSLDPSEASSATATAGWRYVGAESVAGRPADHLTCAAGDLWIDDATRLILRVRQPDLDDAGNPVPGGAVQTTEVTKIEFGEQPAELFALTPPNGAEAMSTEEYQNLCPGDSAAFQERPCSGTPPAAVTPTAEPEPSPTPTVRPSPGDCAIPSPDASTPTGPLAWTPASLTQDWPAPIRPEPAGGASVEPMPPTYIDPSGDTGSTVLPCIDIRDLTVGDYDVSLDLVSNQPPDVDPSKAWIAYGVVVDEDHDGVPDWRYGIDNLPRTAGDENYHHREWRTDLHTGRTESATDWDWAKVSQTYLLTRYPTERRENRQLNGAGAGFYFGLVFDTTQGTNVHGVKVNVPFYAWASVIVDGRVVATDYAPDAGWLHPTPGANPGGTYDLPGIIGASLPFHLSMTIPNGWSAGGAGVSDHRKGDEGDLGIGLDVMTIDEPLAIGCERSEGPSSEVPVGPSVDDLVTFLEGLQTKKISDKTDVSLKISENTDVTVDGYRGKYLEYTATVRDDNCGHGGWPATGNDEYTQAVWILDVDGVRLVIHASAPTNMEAARAELQQIVASIDIGP